MSIISVIVPCYNQGKYLSEALESVKNQTYSRWECIIVNDGSYDDTNEVALGLCKKDERIKYIYKDNGGLSSARNAGLQLASGSLIQFLDADDLLAANKLQESIDIFNSDESIDIVFTNFIHCGLLTSKTFPPWCDISNREFSYSNILLKWDVEYTIPIHCALFNARLFEGFSFNEQLKAKEDWLMWLHVFKSSPHYSFINKPHAIYRRHESSMTKNWTHIYDNTFQAFNYIAENEEMGELIVPFFKNVNRYWKEQLDDTINSRDYRMGNSILKPLRNLVKKLK